MTGQRNAIDGRIVEIVAELDRGGLVGITGARSVPALVAWKTGSSSTTAHTIATIASRLEQFPRCAAGLREGRLSLDQVGVIAERAPVWVLMRIMRRWPTHRYRRVRCESSAASSSRLSVPVLAIAL